MAVDLRSNEMIFGKWFMKTAMCLGVAAGFILVMLMAASDLAAKEPAVGSRVGKMQFAAPITPEDQAYLGLEKAEPFTLKDIKAPFVLVESFNTGCPHCMEQAPVLNRLFALVQKDPQLKDRLKFIAAGQVNDANEVKRWKTVRKVPFAVVPDPDGKVGSALGFASYPISVVLDKEGKVLWVHAGTFESAEGTLKAIKKALK